MLFSHIAEEIIHHSQLAQSEKDEENKEVRHDRMQQQKQHILPAINEFTAKSGDNQAHHSYDEQHPIPFVATLRNLDKTFFHLMYIV
jgi:hypothetical protein